MAWGARGIGRALGVVPALLVCPIAGGAGGELPGHRDRRPRDRAWLGLVPRQNSTGGKARLGGISKRGDSYLRRLLVNSAHTVLLCSKAAKTDPWLTSLLGRKPRLVAVALFKLGDAGLVRCGLYKAAAISFDFQSAGYEYSVNDDGK